MCHLTRSFKQVLASRTNSYLVALATMAVSSMPLFQQGKESTHTDLPPPPPPQTPPTIEVEVAEHILTVPLVQVILAPEK